MCFEHGFVIVLVAGLIAGFIAGFAPREEGALVCSEFEGLNARLLNTFFLEREMTEFSGDVIPPGLRQL